MLKYECDECGQLVNEAEMVNSEHQYVFSGTDPKLVVFIGVAGNSTTKQHFCKACMWQALEEMMERMSPKKFIMEVPNAEDNSGCQVSDTVLHELHAEGHLPESGTDEPTYRNNPKEDGDKF